MSKRVIIIGGGLAGISASASLTDRGYHTTLIERRTLLGGRATSFQDPQSDLLLDNCQHVLLGCCTALLDLYRRLGVSDQIEFFDTIHFADQTAKRSTLYATSLPSPLHLSLAMLRFDLLTLSEKFQIARAMAAMQIMGAEGRQTLESTTFGSWLTDHGQSPRTIARFWNIILTSALNEDVSRVSAKYGLQVFQEAFLGPRDAWRMALPTVPLAQLYAKAVAGQVLMGTRVTGLIRESHRVVGVKLAPKSGESEEQILQADFVVLATAPDAARAILGPGPLPRIDSFTFSPIIGAHFWYDHNVMELPHLALIGTQLQWLFRKNPEGTHLHGVVSAARDLVEMEPAALAELFDKEVRMLLPQSRDAKLLRWRIVKEKRATFSPLPGLDRIRPAADSGIPGLILAGDYTQTDWPATMEGAVRSGRNAADAIVRLT